MHIYKLLLVFLSLSFTVSANAQEIEDVGETALSFFARPEQVPPYAFLTKDGIFKNLGEFKDKVVLVNVWATWCAPCLAEMPSLDKLQRRYEIAGLQVVPLSLDSKIEDVEKFYEVSEIKHLPIYLDTGGKLAKSLNAEILPASFLVNRQGKIVAELKGAANWFGDNGRNLIEQELRK